jgi:hypothetical protein
MDGQHNVLVNQREVFVRTSGDWELQVSSACGCLTHGVIHEKNTQKENDKSMERRYWFAACTWRLMFMCQRTLPVGGFCDC